MPSTMVPPVRMARVVCVMLTPLRINCSVDIDDLLPSHQIDDPSIQKGNLCPIYLMDRVCGVTNLGMGKHSPRHSSNRGEFRSYRFKSRASSMLYSAWGSRQ